MPIYNYSNNSAWPNLEYHYNQCYHCNDQNLILINIDHLESWKNGMFIQNAFPYLSVDQRELIKTGIHPECWNNMFKGDDE